MTLPGKVIRINDHVTIRLMPTNHLPPRLRRLQVLQGQQDESNVSECSNSALLPLEEPANTAISLAESNTPAITKPPSPQKKRTRRSREKENHITLPIALKWRHRIRAKLDHGTVSTTCTTID